MAKSTTTTTTSKTSNRIQTKNLNPLELKLKCAECIHFDIKAHPEIKRVCKDIGIKTYSKICDRYTPNTSRMARSVGALEGIMDLVSNMDESDIRLMLHSVMNANKIPRNTKFSFGEKVYFNLSAPYVEYIDSYYSGIVIAYIQGDDSSEEGYLQIAGSLTGRQGTSITIPVKDVVSEKEWNKLFRKLLNANKFYTPSTKRLRVECSEPTSAEDYVVPTLDDDVKTLETRSIAQQKGKAKAINPALDTFRSSAYNNDEDENYEGEENAKGRGRDGSSQTKFFSY